MKVVTERSPPREARMAERLGGKSGMRSSSSDAFAFSGRQPTIQRKTGCPCGGGCPRCKEEGSLRAKLKVGAPDDRYEREADRVAERVMRMPEPGVSRPDRARSATARTSEVTPGGSNRIDVLRGGGRPIDPGTLGFMERRFGYDFGDVRVHTGAEAAEATGAIHARAFTLGKVIAFGAGDYEPGTRTGRRLLAHELTHVIQQERAEASPRIQRTPEPVPEPVEEEASFSMGAGPLGSFELVMEGKPFRILDVTGPLHRMQRNAVNDYAVYPNLSSGGSWALLIPPAGSSPPSGNCLGYAKGKFGTIRPEQEVWEHGAAARAEGAAGRDVWDLYMKDTFEAIPVDGDTEANFALYGNGFNGSGEGPTHIAARVKGGDFWLSKPSETMPPVLHQSAIQMSGGQMGDEMRLYKSDKGPPEGIFIRRKQEAVTTEPVPTSPNE